MNKNLIMALVIGVVIGLLVMYGYTAMTGYAMYGSDTADAKHAKLWNVIRGEIRMLSQGDYIDGEDMVIVHMGETIIPGNSPSLSGKPLVYVGIVSSLPIGGEVLDAEKTDLLTAKLGEAFRTSGIDAGVARLDMLELRTIREISDTQRGDMLMSEPGEWKMLVDNLDASILAVREEQGLQTSDIAWIISGRTTVGPIGDYMIRADRLGAGVLVSNILNIPLTEVLMDNLAAILGPSEVLSMPLSEVLASITASPTTFGLPSSGGTEY